MIEVRFHGRGGQGAVTAVELLAQAAIAEGKYAQGFPNFGAERRGAPVTAFLRISEDPIYTRERIESPDVVVVLDDSLLGLDEVFSGLACDGDVIVNTPAGKMDRVSELKGRYRVSTVDATAIAFETLGVPIANTAIMGALIRATEIVDLGSLEPPIKHRFGRLAEKNLAAVRRAHEEAFLIEGPGDAGGAVQPETCEPFRIEALRAWKDLEIGGDISAPGSSAAFLTGNWRTTGRPVTDFEKCIKCGQCWIVCPDVAYRPDEEGTYQWDGRYCKGCGICAVECPKDAIEMRSEA